MRARNNGSRLYCISMIFFRLELLGTVFGLKPMLYFLIQLYPPRNTGKTILKRNMANPRAMLLAGCCLLDAACWMLLAGCLLLRHLGLNQPAEFIHSAIIKTVIQNKVSSSSILEMFSLPSKV